MRQPAGLQSPTQQPEIAGLRRASLLLVPCGAASGMSRKRKLTRTTSIHSSLGGGRRQVSPNRQVQCLHGTGRSRVPLNVKQSSTVSLAPSYRCGKIPLLDCTSRIVPHLGKTASLPHVSTLSRFQQVLCDLAPIRGEAVGSSTRRKSQRFPCGQ